MSSALRNAFIKRKFVCLVHYEIKQTEMSEFRAEKGLLQGPSKCYSKNWVLSLVGVCWTKRHNQGKEQESDLLLGELWGFFPK